MLSRRESATAVATSQLLQRKNAAAAPTAGLLSVSRSWPRWNPPSQAAVSPAIWMLMISAPTLKMTWRSGTRLRVDNRHCVTPPTPATIIVWSGPSSTSDMKSVKYDIDSVALPLTSGRCTFEAEINRRRPEQRNEQERLVERDVREPQREDQERPADDGADVCREHAGRCAHAVQSRPTRREPSTRSRTPRNERGRTSARSSFAEARASEAAARWQPSLRKSVLVRRAEL